MNPRLGWVRAGEQTWVNSRERQSPRGVKGRALAMVDALEEQIQRHAADLELAVLAEDVRRIVGEGKIAALMGLEGGHAIEDDLGNLREFRERGVRYVTLTWNNTNNWADSSSGERRHGGLTEFGREVVREMNRLGMIVDVSHASDETFWDALEVTRAPLMASHSSARALVDNPRNMDDDMLRAVGSNGGIVMVNFGGHFIDPGKATRWRLIKDAILHWGPSPVALDLLLDHIGHVVDVTGIDHVGLGSDFDGTLFLPDGASDVSGFPRVTAGLLERGYSEAEVRKILGENALRVLEQAEALAR
jgi:membrane dipeptidase